MGQKQQTDTGENALLQALEEVRRTRGEEHPDYGRALNELAELYRKAARYEEAESLFKEALPVYRSSLGRGHRETGYVLNNLALIYRAMGRYVESEDLYRQASPIFRAKLGPDAPDLAIYLNNVASLYDDMGLYESAQPYYQEAINILEKAGLRRDPRYALLLNNVGLLYWRAGQLEDAEPALRRAVDLRGKTLGLRSLLRGTSLGNLGLCLLSLGRLEEAKAALEESLAILSETWNDDHPEILKFRTSLGVLYVLQEHTVAAEAIYREALPRLRRVLGDLHPDVARVVANLATVCAGTGRTEEALELLQEAMRSDERQIGQVFSLSSDRQRIAMLARLRLHFDMLLSLVRPLSGSEDAVEAAFTSVLRRKALTVEAWAAQRDLLLAGRHPELQPLLERRNVLTGWISRETMAGPCDANDAEDHRKRLAGWESEREEVEAELARSIPEVALERRLSAVDAAVVAKILPADAALVEIVRFAAYDLGGRRFDSYRYAAFLVLHGAPPRMFDLGEADRIDRRVQEFRRAILRLEEPETSGKTLRRAVVDPLRSALGGCKRLFLVPDGDLSYLPFEALPTEDGGRLLDGHQISYLSAGRDLLRLYGEAAQPAAGPSLVVADPDFDLAGPESATQDGSRPSSIRDLFEPFDALSGTREEGKQIAQLLGVAPVLKGAALERSVKACRSPYVLHLATHGFLLADPGQAPLLSGAELLEAETVPVQEGLSGLGNPLIRSGLALAGANTWLRRGSLPEEAEDGLLTAEDVTAMELSGTRLAVLSACETGLGETRAAEGVFGLRRAFVLAGVRTLVMSLWKVPDEETQLLMGRFYSGLQNGLGCEEALRQAKQSLRAEAGRRKPFFWAAFILQGETGPVPLAP